MAGLLADPDLDVTLDPAAPVAEATEAAEAAQHDYSLASGAHATAERTADELVKLRPLLEGRLAALAPLTERADLIRQLADLANGQGANQYKMTLSSFVLAARLEEVAAAASQRLAAMTGGRYSLAHSDAKKGNSRAGLSLLACDSWTGVDRDTATLSGGETFLASLSLALGLADVVTAEAAGTPMEALFVDEGFGTLDEETLDEVMNVLDGLRAGRPDRRHRQPRHRTPPAHPRPGPRRQGPPRQPRDSHCRLASSLAHQGQPTPLLSRFFPCASRPLFRHHSAINSMIFSPKKSAYAELLKRDVNNIVRLTCEYSGKSRHGSRAITDLGLRSGFVVNETPD